MDCPWPHRIAIALGGLLICPPPARADLAPRPGAAALPYLQFVFVAVVVAAVARLLQLLVQKIFFPARSAQTKPFLGFGAMIAAIVVGLGGYAATREMAWFDRANKSRFETQSNLGAIRGVELAYFAEWNIYVGNQPLTPVTDRRGRPDLVEWTTDTRFSIIGFAPVGSVRCSYALEGTDWPSANEGFTARAECDLDDNGKVSIFTVTNGQNEIIPSGDFW